MAWTPIITASRSLTADRATLAKLRRVRRSVVDRACAPSGFPFPLPHLKTTVYQSLTMGGDTRPITYLFWIVAYFAVATPVA
jgi:hypothetical protein